VNFNTYREHNNWTSSIPNVNNMNYRIKSGPFQNQRLDRIWELWGHSAKDGTKH